MSASALAPQPRIGSTRLSVVSIRDFRNLERVDIELPPEGVALVGDNGQGKTNLLESLYYLQLLRSFRGARDVDLVRFGADGFHLAASVHGGRARAVSVGFQRAGKRKRARIDDGVVPRLTDALGAFAAVIFSPADAVLVSGAPSERRRFLDVALALTSRQYLNALSHYRAALANRNAALRNMSGGDVESRVSVWEPALAEHGAILWRARREWVDAHAAHFSELCAAIGENGSSRIRYVSALDTKDDAETALRVALERKRPLDIRRGLTHAGPHRDDLELTLDSRELRLYGSAGQQRTAAMALRLLEAATLRAATGTEPVTLLDDPFAELDARRSSRIFELLESEGRGQTVLAVPRQTDIPQGLTRLDRWRISAGSIIA
ncbi:MAG: DNA replication and repair protein RecF [Gemmatimonadota bacterium]|nr:DNA replication and repair protein RecF [Gemmatimonadota bacterium]